VFLFPGIIPRVDHNPGTDLSGNGKTVLMTFTLASRMGSKKQAMFTP
jgi:hypothetical protein